MYIAWIRRENLLRREKPCTMKSPKVGQRQKELEIRKDQAISQIVAPSHP